MMTLFWFQPAARGFAGRGKLDAAGIQGIDPFVDALCASFFLGCFGGEPWRVA